MKAKVLLLSTGDVHGAYEAIHRIASFIQEAGHEVVMLVKSKTKNDNFVIEVKSSFKSQSQSSLIKRVLRKFNPDRRGDGKIPEGVKTLPKYLFLDEDESVQHYSAADLLKHIPFKPDLIISGMTNGFINTTTLADIQQATGAKAYLLTVDMFPLTGGCHYAWGCLGYQSDCSNCPGIVEESQKDWAHKNFMIKAANISRGDIGIIAGSEWTVNQARSSTFFKEQKEILNTNSCIDIRLFHNRNRVHAKSIFNIPDNAKLIFTGSLGVHDERKGLKYFIEALQELYTQLPPSIRDITYVLIVGNDGKSPVMDEIPFKKHVIDYIKDYRLLSLLYQAADIFVCASIEDSGPMMVSEALACGTPVVGFKMGIMANMVETGYNGYKAELRNSHQLALGLKEILTLTEEEFKRYSDNAVKQVHEHSSQRKVIEVIEQLLKV